MDVTQCIARGFIARCAKRRLRGARDGLSAAVDAKELKGLQSALQEVHTPRRAFFQKAPLEFTLHVPEMPSVMELHGDLVEEERVNTALAQKLAGDLDKEYPSILAELTIAHGLKEKLGRPVEQARAALAHSRIPPLTHHTSHLTPSRPGRAARRRRVRLRPQGRRARA